MEKPERGAREVRAQLAVDRFPFLVLYPTKTVVIVGGGYLEERSWKHTEISTGNFLSQWTRFNKPRVQVRISAVLDPGIH